MQNAYLFTLEARLFMGWNLQKSPAAHVELPGLDEMG